VLCLFNAWQLCSLKAEDQYFSSSRDTALTRAIFEDIELGLWPGRGTGPCWSQASVVGIDGLLAVVRPWNHAPPEMIWR
jgi:hypothetical protein